MYRKLWFHVAMVAMLSAVLLGVLAPSASARKILEAPFDTCVETDAASPGAAESEARCNALTGFLSAYSNAWVGAAAAEAVQYVVVDIPGQTNLDFDVKMLTTGGAITTGFGSAAGTDKVWIWATTDNRHTSGMQGGLGFEWAVEKIIALALLAGGASQTWGDAIDYMAFMIDTASLLTAFQDAVDAGDGEEVHMNFSHWVPSDTQLPYGSDCDAKHPERSRARVSPS